MINRGELVHVGIFRKPHGTKGEIGFSFIEGIAGQARNDISDRVIASSPRHPHSTDVIAGLTRNPLAETCTFFICEIDGIFVPFHIENYRPVSDSSAYILLKNINSEEKARELSHKEVFLHKTQFKGEIKKESLYWEYFTGFTLIDERLGTIGTITDIDTTTINTLFIIENETGEILIPAAEEFIIRLDENQKELIVSLPEGLVEKA